MKRVRPKRELAERLSDKSGLTRKLCHKVLTDLTEVMRESLAEGREVRFYGFGKFWVEFSRDPDCKDVHVFKAEFFSTLKRYVRGILEHGECLMEERR